MSCRLPDDVPGDPTSYLIGDKFQNTPPTEVFVSYRQRTISVYYKPAIHIPSSAKAYLFLNGKILDKDYVSGKHVQFSDISEVQLPLVAVVPVTGAGLNDPTYNPLCGQVISMFSLIARDIILSTDDFVCQPIDIFTPHHGVVHKNFIDPSFNQKSVTIAIGDEAHLAAGRLRVVGQEIIAKPAGTTRRVISLRDYRFHIGFDKSAFQIQVGGKAQCYPYPAKRTTKFARIPEGVFSLEELSLK